MIPWLLVSIDALLKSIAGQAWIRQQDHANELARHHAATSHRRRVASPGTYDELLGVRLHPPCPGCMGSATAIR